MLYKFLVIAIQSFIAPKHFEEEVVMLQRNISNYMARSHYASKSRNISETWNISETFQKHFGNILETFWKHFGNIV